MFFGKFNCLELDNIFRICKICEEKRIILFLLIKCLSIYIYKYFVIENFFNVSFRLLKLFFFRFVI